MIVRMILHSALKQDNGGSSAEFYAIASALVIGIPSIVISIATFMAGSKARSIQEQAQHARVDADAYIRAKELYESMYNEMRSRINDLHEEITRLNTEISRLKSETTNLNGEVIRLNAELREARQGNVL